MSAPYTFRVAWPVEDETLTPRQLMTEAAVDLGDHTALAGVDLTGPVTFSIVFAPGLPPILTATATARRRKNARRFKAVCGTDSGYYRHTRTLREPARGRRGGPQGPRPGAGGVVIGLILLATFLVGSALAMFGLAVFSDKLDRESDRTRGEHEWAPDSDDEWLTGLRGRLDTDGWTEDGLCACAVCVSHRNTRLGGTSATWDDEPGVGA